MSNYKPLPKEINGLKIIKDLGRIYPTEKSKRKERFAILLCRCGEEFRARTDSIKNGSTTSCGCVQRSLTAERSITHNLSKHPLYKTWGNMKRRCYNKNREDYDNYGGRGIKVCDRWLDSFPNFLSDMGVKPSKSHSLDRKENDGDYTPENCRWATKEEQTLNQRIMKTNKTDFVGISFSGGKLRSVIYYKERQTHLGTFDTPEEAARVRDKYIIDNNLPHKLSKL